MALEFYLRLQTSLSPGRVLDLLLQQDGFMRSQNDGDFYAEGLVGWVYAMNEISQQVTFEDIGVKANLSIRCWHDYDEYENGMRNILKIFMFILSRIDGDAVLEHDTGFINLLRKNGKTILDSRAFSENEEAMWRFKDIPFEYEVKDLNLSE